VASQGEALLVQAVRAVALGRLGARYPCLTGAIVLQKGNHWSVNAMLRQKARSHRDVPTLVSEEAA
jgi:hypothetical protein